MKKKLTIILPICILVVVFALVLGIIFLASEMNREKERRIPVKMNIYYYVRGAADLTYLCEMTKENKQSNFTLPYTGDDYLFIACITDGKELYSVQDLYHYGNDCAKTAERGTYEFSYTIEDSKHPDEDDWVPFGIKLTVTIE